MTPLEHFGLWCLRGWFRYARLKIRWWRFWFQWNCPHHHVSRQLAFKHRVHVVRCSRCEKEWEP